MTGILSENRAISMQKKNQYRLRQLLNIALLVSTTSILGGCAATQAEVPGDGLEPSSKLQRQDPLSTWQRQESTLKFME